MNAVVTLAAALALAVTAGGIGWLLGYQHGLDDARAQAADTFTRYLRRQETHS